MHHQVLALGSLVTEPKLKIYLRRTACSVGPSHLSLIVEGAIGQQHVGQVRVGTTILRRPGASHLRIAKDLTRAIRDVGEVNVGTSAGE